MKKHKYTKEYFIKYGMGYNLYDVNLNNPTYKKIVAELKDLGVIRGKLLDIGCAKGFFLKKAAEVGYEIFGVDISKYAVNEARKFLNTNQIYRVDLTNQRLPFRTNELEIVTMLDCLEHIENPQNALRDVKRVLKKGGILHIRLPGFERGLHEITHVNFYTLKSIKILLERHGFKILKLGEEGGKLQIPFGIIRLIVRRNTHFNFVPKGTGSFISCYAVKR